MQTGQENSLLADTGEFRPDTISSGGLIIIPSQEDDDLGIIDAALYET
jgi:hypothetical protein